MRHLVCVFALWAVCAAPAVAYEPIHIGFLWHMHQPIYYPYENPIEVDNAGRFSFSVVDVHNQRFGPYTWWPDDAVAAGSGLPHLGAQVSFTGSLIENLNALDAGWINGGMWSNWKAGYRQGVARATTLGNPRLDLVAFGYHHPLMPLLDAQDIRMQIKLHKHIYGQSWTGGPAYSRGMFPAETAFSTRMIPALVAEGIDWVLVDNIHFDRACAGYPHTNDSGMFAPNPADQLNPDPAAHGGAWVQLNNVWAPSRVSVPFGYQPHYVQHVDPDTGVVTRMIAVPAARYEGNEDGRGGYGAFLYDQVMDQYIGYNVDPAHPMFVVLHHDGDNYGGGSESYYHHNFQNMVSWVGGDPDYDVSTVQDYLDRFPPDVNDVIHVEDGSWAGADNGDPEFKKWLADPDASGWSPDRNSWAVLTAAKNRVFTAEAIDPATNMQNVMDGVGGDTEKAWHWLLVSQASDYWYWDGTEIWDSDVTRGCNQAVIYADAVIAGGADATPPTIFVPQREPYNPGGYEWAQTTESSDFEVWTYVYDVSGLADVTLKYRVDADGANPLSSIENETYAGGAEVGPWQTVAMSSSDVPPPAGILAPTYRALRYAGTIAGESEALLDYYVEATDNVGNVARSPIMHVYVGTAGGNGGGDAVTIAPDPPVAGEDVTIAYDPAGRVLAGAAQVYLHYGFNGWSPTISPDVAMSWNPADEVWEATVPMLSSATTLNMAFRDDAPTWDNNGGADWNFAVSGGAEPHAWQMDGQLDADATLVAENNGMALYAGVAGDVLYVATWDAGEGNDHFVFIADAPGVMQAAPWAKAGQVAGWSAFVGNENDNAYAGWFDQTGAAAVATGGGGGYLEATLNLAEEFGVMPAEAYVAVAPFENPDGGALMSPWQVPASLDEDGDLDADEYLMLDLCALRVDRSPADLNADCSVNIADVDLLTGCLSGPETPATCGETAADIDGDGDVDLADVGGLAELYE